jgi:hypothetical protein
MTTSNYHKPIPAALSLRLLAAALMFGALSAPGQAGARQPGSGAVVSMRLSSSAEPVEGWSVKRGLLGRAVYASAEGKQIGTVLDLVVTAAAAPYVLIIGAAGAIEVGGHAVAVPLADVVEHDGVLILPNATRASLKAMPRFTYSTAATHRAHFIRATSAQLGQANAQLLVLQRQAAAATGADRTQRERANAALQADITAAEDRLSNLEKAEVSRWVLLRGDLREAMARVLVALPRPAPDAASNAPARP